MSKPVTLTRWSIVVRDWLGSDTLRGMSAEAECLFLRLCLDQWEHGFARSSEAFWKGAHAHRMRDWCGAWSEATAHFQKTPEGLVHPRVAKDREESLVQVTKLSAMGTKAAQDRWNRVRDADRIGGASTPNHSASASASASGSQNSPPPPPGAEPQVAPLPEPKPKKAAKVRIDPETHPLPASLDFPDVREALVDYLATRKGGVWDEKLARVWLKRLVAWGRERTVAALRNSIGAQGVFEPHGGPKLSAPPTPKQPSQAEIEAKRQHELQADSWAREFGKGPYAKPKAIVDPVRSQDGLRASGTGG